MGSKKSARKAGKMRKDKARLKGGPVYTYEVHVGKTEVDPEKMARAVDKRLAEQSLVEAADARRAEQILNQRAPLATQFAIDHFAHDSEVSYPEAWRHFQRKGYDMSNVAGENTAIDDVIGKNEELEVGLPLDSVSPEAAAAMQAALTMEPTDEQLAAGEPVQPRWEEAVYDGIYEGGVRSVYDNLTGLHAVCEDDDEVAEVLHELNVEHGIIEAFSWRHKRSDAEVLVTHEKETNQFWLLVHDDAGFGILDRVTQKVLPLAPEFSLRTAVDLTAGFNNFTESIKVEEFEWVEAERWVEAPPEDVAPQAADAQLTDEPMSLRVLVVSSRDWSFSGPVVELIQTLWNRAGNPPMTILTSGMPHGAEGVASGLVGVEVEHAPHQITHEVIRDEAIGSTKIDYAFAFITNYSDGASKALDAINMAGIPVHVMSETSAKPRDPWAER